MIEHWEWLDFSDIWPRILTTRVIFVFLDKKIARNLKITCQISMHFYAAVYFSWLYKSNESGTFESLVKPSIFYRVIFIVVGVWQESLQYIPSFRYKLMCMEYKIITMLHCNKVCFSIRPIPLGYKIWGVRKPIMHVRCAKSYLRDWRYDVAYH